MRITIQKKINRVLALGLNIALCFGTFILPTKVVDATESNNATSVDYYYAKISDKSVSLHTNVVTTSDSETLSYYGDTEKEELMFPCSHGDFGAVSELTQFIDYKGNINIAYSDSKYIYIHRFTKTMNLVDELKINKKYPLLGDVVNDKYGNYYVVWGKEDTKCNGGVVTMAVTKYSYEGKFIKEATYITTEDAYGSWDTRIPFDAGNCSTIIKKDGTLVCSYGREMYNGHQSNHVLCVNTESMTMVESYNNYASHSFDQRVIELSDGGICFVNKGDAYPRGFNVEFFECERKSDTTFHFYGSLGNNYVYASLGGVVQANDNIFLVGASSKSMTASASKEGANLFIQLVGSDETIEGSVTRKGTCCDKETEDIGVKWLTNYTGGYTVNNPQTVPVDDGKFVIMWEKMKNKSFVESYYMIIDSNGNIVQKATQMNKVRLNAHEDPIYSDGCIYWVTAGYIDRYVMNGKKGVIHKLEVGKTVKILDASKLTEIYCDSNGVTIKWNKVAGADKYRVYRKLEGKNWTKIFETSKTNFTDKTAKKGAKYSYTVRCVDSSGKEYTTNYDKIGKSITPVNKPQINKITNESSGIKITWSKVKGAEKYRLYRKVSNGKWVKVCDTSKNYYVDKKVKSGSYSSYRLRCVNSTGKILESGMSATKSIKRLEQPQFTNFNRNGNSLKLVWKKVTGAKSYYVYRKEGNGKWNKIKTVKTNSYKDTKLNTEKKYYYYVKAVNGNYCSSKSTTRSIGVSVSSFEQEIGIDSDWFDFFRY